MLSGTRQPRSRFRQMAILFALLLFGFSVTGIGGYFYTVTSLEEHLRESGLPLASDTIHAELARVLEKPVSMSEQMARNTFVHRWILEGEKDRTQIEQYLKGHLEDPAVFTAFFISDLSREYYHPGGKRRRISEDNPENVWYFAGRDMPDNYAVIVSIDEMNRNAPVVFVNHKVQGKDGRFLGLIGVGITLNRLQNQVRQHHENHGYRVLFTDKQGQVLLSSDTNATIPANIHNDPVLASAAREILQTDQMTFRGKRADRDVFIITRKVDVPGWYLILEKGTIPAAFLNSTMIGNLVIALSVMLAVLWLANIAINRYQHKLEEMANTDSLTGTHNRRALNTLLPAIIGLSTRRSKPLCGLMVDIDHFKSINDNLGHMAGDEVLKSVSAALRASVRQSDIICRWGGEEFFILLEDCDGKKGLEIAEKIRDTIATTTIEAGQPIHVTASIGFAICGHDESSDDFVNRADHAMYQAKEQGRNRVAVSQPSLQESDPEQSIRI